MPFDPHHKLRRKLRLELLAEHWTFAIWIDGKWKPCTVFNWKLHKVAPHLPNGPVAMAVRKP